MFGMEKTALMPRSLEPRHGEEVSGNTALVSCPEGQSFWGPIVHTFFARGVLLEPRLPQHCYMSPPPPSVHLCFARPWASFPIGLLIQALLWPTYCLCISRCTAPLPRVQSSPLIICEGPRPGPSSLDLHSIQSLTTTAGPAMTVAAHHPATDTHPARDFTHDLGPAMFSGEEDANLRS